MRPSLPPSPTPKNVADAYAVRVAEQADALAGRDGRITVHEAGKRPELFDAHRRTGRSRPVVRTAVEAARAAMLAEARRAAGTDGRVSLADAERMSPPFAQAFAALREIPREQDEARAVVAELDRLVPGLSFTSESDYGYEPFAVALDPGAPLTLEVLQRILPWNEGPVAQREWEPPTSLRLEVSADDSFWQDEAAKDPYYGADFRALDRLMKRSFSEETIRMDGESLTARIFSVTLPEADAALAPYFVLGRLATGEVVGLRTFRVWT
jgi:hypothetical protein